MQILSWKIRVKGDICLTPPPPPRILALNQSNPIPLFIFVTLCYLTPAWLTTTVTTHSTITFLHFLLDLKCDSLVCLWGRGFIWSVRVREKCQRDLAQGWRSNQVTDVGDLTKLLRKQLVLLPRHLQVFGRVDPFFPHTINVEPVSLVAVHHLKRGGGGKIWPYLYHTWDDVSLDIILVNATVLMD